MKATVVKFKTTNEYFAALTATQKKILHEYRDIIRSVVPKAEEVISYNMPAFTLNGILVWYAIYKNHVGLYPKSNAIKVFENELSAYKTSKGAIQFPIDQPIPVSLVKKIVRLRIKENSEAMNMKAKIKKG